MSNKVLVKDIQFHKELKELLKKFDAELMIEDFGTGVSVDKKIVVNFNWNVKFDNSPTPQLILGTYEDGDI